MTKNNMVRKGCDLYIQVTIESKSVPELKKEIWKQELKAETLNYGSLLDCVPWLAQPAFSHIPGPPAQGWHKLQWTVHFHVNR